MTAAVRRKPRETRPLTGLPSWPIMLLAGVQKAGKTHQAVAASASPLIGRTFLVIVGEDVPDEYALIPGSRAEVVKHDGTFGDIVDALGWAVDQPPTDGKPNLLVLDSATPLWEQLQDQQQTIANARASRRSSSGRSDRQDDAQITSDQWNAARGKWRRMADELRRHQGPSIVTARLESVAVMDAAGNPTKERDWSIKAHKSLPSDVGVIVELRSRTEAWISGVRSMRLDTTEGRTRFPDFTVARLWAALGLAEGAEVGFRDHSATDASLDADDVAAADPVAAREAVSVARRAVREAAERAGVASVPAAYREHAADDTADVNTATAPQLAAFARWLGELPAAAPAPMSPARAALEQHADELLARREPDPRDES